MDPYKGTWTYRKSAGTHIKKLDNAIWDLTGADDPDTVSDLHPEDKIDLKVSQVNSHKKLVCAEFSADLISQFVILVDTWEGQLQILMTPAPS